jgi:threonine/homoserine/homoserine lactone efflux protein
MTVTLADLALYSVALLILFLTPGPVWLALLARSISGGFNAAWPLALGVSLGDIVWPLLAILGLSWIVSEVAGFMTLLKWIACAVFLVMGWQVIRSADRQISRDSRLTRPGMWAGFAAGVVAILGNPKAILFYMGVLPGFFDLAAITAPDIVVIVAMSVVVPLIGNLTFALFIDRMRRLMSSPAALRRINLTAGWALIVVGLIIPLT